MAIRFDVKVEINDAKLKARVDRANEILAVQVMKDTEKEFLPMLNHQLANGTRVIDGTIVYPGPYAHYLWEGEVYVDPMSGAAGFKLKDGSWASRRGVTKIPSGRSLVFTRATARDHWTDHAKERYMNRWEQVYVGGLENGN